MGGRISSRFFRLCQYHRLCEKITRSSRNWFSIILDESATYKLSIKKIFQSTANSISHEESTVSFKMAQFSPVAKSPVTKGSQQKNLTGNSRIVRDLAATIHSSVQQWNDVHLHGLAVLKNIIQIKLDETYPEGLEDLCDDLSRDCAKLDQIVDNLKQSSIQMNAVKSLHKGTGKFFQTWPVERFVETAELIYEAYSKEAEVRRVVLENVAHYPLDSFHMAHVAAWAYQTRISDGITTALESMLVETGHR